MQNSLTLPCRRRLQIMSIPIQQVFLRMMPILKQLQTRLPIKSMTVQVILGTKLTKKKRILMAMLTRKKEILMIKRRKSVLTIKLM